MNQHQRLKYLLQRHLETTITKEEQQELLRISNDPEQEAYFRELLEETWQDLEASRPHTLQHRPLIRKIWFRATVAAAAIFVLLLGGYWWLTRPGTDKTVTPVVRTLQDVQPGREGAILTLADGKQIVLDSLQNGVIAHEKGIPTELRNGQLVYGGVAQSAVTEIPYHTMTTPKGRQFQLRLPDGSQVWLNAASSIKYPVVFTGNERKVIITGEAWFDVAKDASKPFRVITARQEIEVTGTQFNVNAYDNELSDKTTLIEGSVKVTGLSTAENQLLMPGQQAVVEQNAILVKQVDIAPVIAWKNGLFHFVKADIPTVMRQLERWYDVKVRYEGKIPSREFEGKLQRDFNLAEMMTSLEKLDVHCRLEGEKTLVVTP